MAAKMIPLYRTASFLVHANMSIDKGVAMLQRNKQQYSLHDYIKCVKLTLNCI